MTRVGSLSRIRIGTLAIALTVLLTGCVTESTGGLPKPASASDRVQAQLDLARGYLEKGNTERARTSLVLTPQQLAQQGPLAVRLDELVQRL